MANEESEEHLVRYTAEEIDAMIARGEDRTDWERVRTPTDEEIEAAIDIEEGEFDWDVGSIARGLERTAAIITFRCDTDLLEWFQQHGDTPEAQIGRVLTEYVQAQRGRSER